MGLSKKGEFHPKWMVKIYSMENPDLKCDDLAG